MTPHSRWAERLRAAPDVWRAARDLAGWSAQERTALRALARAVADEHVAPSAAPAIAADAFIHPLSTIRFADRVEIGSKATVGPYCCVWGGWSRTWARVGAGALLSPGVVLVAGNHGVEGTGPIRNNPFVEADVVVGAGAWIGAHSVVVGVRVGDGAVIGAGSVVTEDVPDLAIAVGTPARVIGMRG